jgi:hypothetical protein
MKKLFLLAVLACVFFLPSNLFAGEVYTLTWDISSLKDDTGADLLSLSVDLGFGKAYLNIHGVVDFSDGAAGVHGSGYLTEANAYLHLTLQSYFLIVNIGLGTGLGGEIFLYHNGELLDSGTITLADMR